MSHPARDPSATAHPQAAPRAGRQLSAHLPITIVVPVGRFGTVETAAAAEDRVDWLDADLSDDDACTESFAAVELKRWLARALSVGEDEIRLSGDEALPEAGDVFVLGSRRSNPRIDSLLGPERSAGGRATSRARARTGTTGARAAGRATRGSPVHADTAGSFILHALPRGARTLFVIEGRDRAGTLYGVYDFLQRLGVRFYGLGDSGVAVPATPAVLPQKLEIEERPAFTTRGFWAWEPRGNRDFFQWMARNRMNLWTAEEKNTALLKKLGIRLTTGGHGFQKAFLDPGADYPYDHPRWPGDEEKPKDPYAPGAADPIDLDGNGRLGNFEAHPEWYGLHGGKRSANLKDESGDNYCTSNPDATHELIRNLIQSLAHGAMRNADRVELWFLDEGRWCECDRCRAQGSPTDRMLDVLSRVGGAVAEARRAGILERPVEIAGGAYRETLAPPTRFPPLPLAPDVCSITLFPYFRCYAHALADSSCHEINGRIVTSFRGWARSATPDRGTHDRSSGVRGRKPGAALTAVAPLGVGEYYNVSYFATLPLVFPHVMERDVQWYFHSGVRRFHYMHAPTRSLGTWTLNHAVLAALLWNPETDVGDLVADFCRSQYPTTAARMEVFYRNLEQASANILAVEHCIGAFGGGSPAGRLTVNRFPVFMLQHLQLDHRAEGRNQAPSWIEIMDAMRRARADIDAALRECSDSTEAVRIREDERRFGYGEAVFSLYDCLIRVALADRAGDRAAARQAFGPAREWAAKLERIEDLVQVAASHANARNGLAASHVAETYEYYRARYGSEAR